MKKLLLATIVATATVAINAATVSWSATKGALYDGAETPAKITSGSAYLMFVTADYTQSDLVAAFVAAEGKADATLTAMSASGAMATGAGTIAASSSRPSGTSTYGLTADATAYFVVFNDDKMYISYTTDALYDTVTAEATATFGTSLASSSKTTLQAADGYSAAGWYAVPEPTSGLLMLLGMAGLALRRRRAYRRLG